MAEHHAGHTGGGHVQTDETHHHVPLSHYWAVFGVLMVGLLLTVLAATQDFPIAGANVTIAVLIAAIKATCIILIFMHVKYSSRLVKFLAVGAYLWLVILFLLTGMDYASRVNPVGLTPATPPAGTSGQAGTSTGHPPAQH